MPTVWWVSVAVLLVCFVKALLWLMSVCMERPHPKPFPEYFDWEKPILRKQFLPK